MTARWDGPETVRPLVLRQVDRRADVNRARTPLDGVPPGQWSDRDVARWLGWCLLGVLVAVFWIGAAVTGVYCWQHWRGALDAAFIVGCAVGVLVIMRVTKDMP